ncbi:hypothetical protein DRN39_02970 [Thermococci archaeon]|nr:MAG: hypothetical protein DRN39_02970 [Thermococci archaeon]
MVDSSSSFFSRFRDLLLRNKGEGIVPAPESAHAIKAVIDLALEAKKKGEEKLTSSPLRGFQREWGRFVGPSPTPVASFG